MPCFFDPLTLHLGGGGVSPLAFPILKIFEDYLIIILRHKFKKSVTLRLKRSTLKDDGLPAVVIVVETTVILVSSPARAGQRIRIGFCV